MDILLVEDEIDLQLIFKENLLDLGFKVHVSDSVDKALMLYEKLKPQIIISDINLKGKIKGHEIISILAKKYLTTPDVILMTAGYDLTKEEAIKFGAKNLLKKPFKFFEMSLEIQQIILLKNKTERLLNQMSKLSNCHSIGIRLRSGLDYPYYKYKGFSDEFIMIEKFLCPTCITDDKNLVLDCMCGNILQGRFDPKHPFFTINGSFYSNHTSKLLAETTPEERQANTRNYCNKVGYESVALIPIKTKDQSLGLIQLNDYSINKFSKGLIEEIEDIAKNFANEINFII